MTESGQSRRLPLIILFAFLAGWALEALLLSPRESAARPQSSLVVTATISNGGFVEAYINNEWMRSFKAKIVPGVRKRYSFSKVPSRIDAVRLDPTDAPGALIELESIELVLNGKTVSALGAADLAKWGRQALDEAGSEESKVLRLRATSTDPLIIAGGLGMKLPDETTGEFLASHGTLILSLLLSLVLLFSLAGLRVAFPLGVTSAAIYYFGPAFWRFIESHRLPASSARYAVGFASYNGYPKAAEQYFSLAIFGAALLIGAVLSVVRLPSRDESAQAKTFAWGRLGALVAVFAFMMFPSFTASRESIRTAVHNVVGFDWGNVFIWDYLHHYGFLPYRDFWFPYAGEIDQLGGFPESAWEIYLTQLVLFSALLVAFYELTGRSISWAFLLLAGVGLGIINGHFLATKRYLTLIAAVASGAALVSRLPERAFPYACFGVLLGWLFWRDPTLLVYSGPVLLLYVGIGYVRARRVSAGRGWIQNCLITIGFFAALLATKIAVLVLRGQWEGFFNFYERVPHMSATSSVPSPVLDWFALTARYENVLLYGMCAFAALGAYLWLARGPARQKDAGLLLVGISFVTFSLFFKYIVRPHMAQQIAAFIFVSAAISISYLGSQFAPWRKTLLAVLLGVLTGTFHEDVKNFGKRAQIRAETLPEDIEYLRAGLRTPREEFDRYYAPERFQGFDAELGEVIAFLREKNLPAFSRDLYVLGDEVALYAMLKTQPCPFITLYDGSNVWAQREQVECLKNHPPRFVVWNTTYKVFDQVPNVTRSPILFTHFVTSFVPERRIGRFAILRPRAPFESIALDFWREALGETVELGEIPLLTSAAELAECRDDCLEYLEIQNPPREGSASFEAGGMPFRATWRLSRESDRVFIALDRLWFWSAAKTEDLPRRITAPDAPKIVLRENRRDVLY